MTDFLGRIEIVTDLQKRFIRKSGEQWLHDSIAKTICVSNIICLV